MGKIRSVGKIRRGKTRRKSRRRNTRKKKNMRGGMNLFLVNDAAAAAAAEDARLAPERGRALAACKGDKTLEGKVHQAFEHFSKKDNNISQKKVTRFLHNVPMTCKEGDLSGLKLLKDLNTSGEPEPTAKKREMARNEPEHEFHEQRKLKGYTALALAE
jgi:hypothetical protein